jgi:rhodanese-related sulfurtransferase
LTSLRRFLLAYLAVLLLGAVVISFCIQAQQAHHEYGNITAEEAKKLIDSTPNLTIVDVRTDTEYNSSHIPGAINICVCDPNNLLSNLNPNDEILVYCKTGLRSSAALSFLNEHGFNKVYNLAGGLDAWTNADYPTVDH